MQASRSIAWTGRCVLGQTRRGASAAATEVGSSGGALRRCRRAFATSTLRAAKAMPPRPKVDEEEIEESYLKGTGPGGQKINKTNSAVQLKHLPTGLVVKVQATRSRSQNRKLARELLAARVEERERGPDSRAAIVADHKRRKKSSAKKKTRRKYRALDDARHGAAGEVDEEEWEDVADDEDVDPRAETAAQEGEVKHNPPRGKEGDDLPEALRKPPTKPSR